MTQFTAEHFDRLQLSAGQVYEPFRAHSQDLYQSLQPVYQLMDAWAQALQAQLFPQGIVKLHTSPLNPAKRFNTSIEAYIYPRLDAPKQLAYILRLDPKQGFLVKLDTVGLGKDHATRHAFLSFYGKKSSDQPLVAHLPPAAGIAKPLAELIDWSVQAIRGWHWHYDEVLDYLGLGPTLSDYELLVHFDTKPEFKALRSTWTAERTALFCRLVRVIHRAGLDWWHIGQGTQVRFGRKNPQDERALGLLGSVQGKRTLTMSLAALGHYPVRSHQALNHHVIDQLETRLKQERSALHAWLGRPTERAGGWPDQLRDDPFELAEESDAIEFDEPRPAMNRIYYGPPGTGKTYTVQQILYRDYTSAGQAPRYSFVTFHPAYGYEEFIEGLRPVLNSEQSAGQIRYEIRAGVFKTLCEQARSQPQQRFAMVIDEINRGHIGKIFGELLTLIEVDKREGAEQALAVTLPYSGETFSIPANVDLIGTMNTADRSLAQLDIALRRRFEFIPMLPDARDTADAPLAGLRVTYQEHCIVIPRLLEVINQRLELLYDRDHLIGHAYFTALKQTPDGAERFAALVQLFKTRLLPLLEEYFFADWQKISLVLGDPHKPEAARFVLETPQHEQELRRLFGTDYPLECYTPPRTYKLQTEAFEQPLAYVGIYS